MSSLARMDLERLSLWRKQQSGPSKRFLVLFLCQPTWSESSPGNSCGARLWSRALLRRSLNPLLGLSLPLLGIEDSRLRSPQSKPPVAERIRTLTRTIYEKLTKGSMNIIVRYCGLTKRAVWQELVESNLKKLQNLATIATARVTLEWQRGVKPAFRVLTELEVPGPDFHAEASDYTLPAALVKVVTRLEKQIRSRKNRRADKWKTNVRLGLNPARTSSGLVGARS